MTYLEYRLAKAIFHRRMGFDLDFDASAEKQRYLLIARWSLEGLTEVLRAPTPAMLDAGFAVWKHIGANDTLTKVWSEMIAALAREQITPANMRQIG